MGSVLHRLGLGGKQLIVTSLVRRWFPITVLLTAFALLVAACGEEPTPTPSSEPELSVDDLLSNGSAELAALVSAKFEMIDELETGSKFFGMTLKGVTGVVKSPASTSILVELVTPSLGFAEIKIVAVGDSAMIKFSEDAPWAPLSASDVPFNFGMMGVTLSEIVSGLRNAESVGQESVAGAQTLVVQGDTMSENLASLITDASEGYPIKLTLWFDAGGHELRQLRIEGQIFDEDAPETSRLITLSDIDVPIDIQLPDTAAGS